MKFIFKYEFNNSKSLMYLFFFKMFKRIIYLKKNL
jgi:hypothetical protein